MELETRQTVIEFFRENLEKALLRHNVTLGEMTEFYVVNLLAEAADVRGLFVNEKSPDAEEPLAITYGRAMSTPHHRERFVLLKKIGDRSLYISGFFSESLKDKPVDIDYYISMGGNAYLSLSHMASESAKAKPFLEIFSEMADKFGLLVDLIGDISESTGTTSDQDLLRIYERWLATKSERLRERLQEEGIAPIPPEREQIN